MLIIGPIYQTQLLARFGRLAWREGGKTDGTGIRMKLYECVQKSCKAQIDLGERKRERHMKTSVCNLTPERVGHLQRDPMRCKASSGIYSGSFAGVRPQERWGLWTICTAHGWLHLLNCSHFYLSFKYWLLMVWCQVFISSFVVCGSYTCKFLPCTAEFSCWLPLCSDFTSGITASKIKYVTQLVLSVLYQ